MNMQGGVPEKPFYAIHDDTIGDKSVRYSSSTTDSWTVAMKHFLTNFDWMTLISALRDHHEQMNAHEI